MPKAFKLVIVRARHDDTVATIPDDACIKMLMTGPQSVMRFWADTTYDYFDFLDSAMLPWVDITITATDTARATQAKAAFAAVRAREPGRDPLAGFDGAVVLTWPGRITVPNPMQGQPGQPSTIVVYFDAGSTTINGLPVSILTVMSSDHTFMCHEVGHTLGFNHTFGLDNNGTDWNPNDANIIVGPEYGSPYDLMSSASFGSRWLGTGPFYSANPTFTGPALPNWPFAGAFQSGPDLSRANLQRFFPDAMAMHVADRPFPGPGDVGRIRLSAASSRSGTTLLVLHPPGEPPSGIGRVYVEYRDARGWDRGLDASGPDLARTGLVVHTLEDVSGAGPRVWYRGSVPLGALENNLTVPGRPVVISLEEYEDQHGNSWADISYRRSVAVTKSDILWHNASNGAMQIWVMNGGRIAGRPGIVSETGVQIQIGPPWRMVGTGDFNGDGKTDILWMNAADGAMQIWFMDGARIASRAGVVSETGGPERIGHPWRIIGVGDFSGEGKADILWANASDGAMQIWVMTDARVTGRATVVSETGQPERIGYPWRVVAVGDFNGDGKADILWANASDGAMQIWVMNGGKVAGRATVVNETGAPIKIGPPWRIARAGDFNGSGKADILWSNSSDGSLQIWFMDGGRIARRATVVAENGTPVHIGPPWRIVRNGDLNANGIPGILWHNSQSGEGQFWFMESARIASRATVVGENGSPVFIGPPWSIVGTGDFNLNSTGDILWHNSSTGEIQIWFMDLYKITARATVQGEGGTPVFIGPPWSIVGTGDFSLNGTADILWHNSATGETQIWYMDGYRVGGRATVVAENGSPLFVGPPWNIVGIGDFSQNGTADILWHNSSTGEIQMWFMDGSRVAGRATVVAENGDPVSIGPPWSILGACDYNLNGAADILWHNSSTGETQIWFMDGPRIAARATVVGESGSAVFVGPPWSIVAT